MTRTTHVAPVLHHVWYDDPTKTYRGLRRAVCGKTISAADDAIEPTCPECVRILGELDALGDDDPPEAAELVAIGRDNRALGRRSAALETEIRRLLAEGDISADAIRRVLVEMSHVREETARIKNRLSEVRARIEHAAAKGSDL